MIVAWKHLWQERGAGLEHLRLGRRRARGTIVWIDGDDAYRLAYAVRWDDAWRTRSLSARIIRPAGRGSVELAGDGAGAWTIDGRPAPALDGCIDVDLWPTPFTNTLPIRRLPLEPGASATIRVAWLTAPGLEVHAREQRYTFVGGGAYRFESPEDGFVADLRVDERGLVVAYPGLFERIA